MSEEKFPNVTTYVNVEKGGINIQHVEHFHQAQVLKALDDPDDDELVQALMPIFYNVEDEVRRFVKGIQGADDKLITDLVRRLVEEDKINPRAKGRPLFKILHDAGIYHSSETNWNSSLRY